MKSSDMVKTAERIAREAHDGQYRRDGETPYITHPESVANSLSGESDEVIATAWLHDVVEDTDVVYEDLLAMGMPMVVVDAVAALTKVAWESDIEYIGGIKRNAVARKVKIADMRHNLSCEPTDKQRKRYERGLALLA